MDFNDDLRGRHPSAVKPCDAGRVNLGAVAQVSGRLDLSVAAPAI